MAVAIVRRFQCWNPARRSGEMQRFAETCEAVAGTTKKLEKIRIVAEYFRGGTVEEAAAAAVFLSGKPFPAWEESTLQVGSRQLWQVLAELAGKNDEELTVSYRRLGDLGAVAADVLPEASDRAPLHVAEAE